MTITIDPSAFAHQCIQSSHVMLGNQHNAQSVAASLAKPVANGKMPPSRWPKLMRKPEVAEYLSVSERYVDTLMADGYVPGPRFTPSARCVLWDREEIDRWIEKTNAEAGTNGRAQSFDDIVRYRFRWDSRAKRITIKGHPGEAEFEREYLRLVDLHRKGHETSLGLNKDEGTYRGAGTAVFQRDGSITRLSNDGSCNEEATGESAQSNVTKVG